MLSIRYVYLLHLVFIILVCLQFQFKSRSVKAQNEYNSYTSCNCCEWHSTVGSPDNLVSYKQTANSNPVYRITRLAELLGIIMRRMTRPIKKILMCIRWLRIHISQNPSIFNQNHNI